MCTHIYAVLDHVYLHKLVQLPGSTTEVTGARPNQAITEVLEGLPFNNEHLLVARVTVSSVHSYIHNNSHKRFVVLSYYYAEAHSFVCVPE